MKKILDVYEVFHVKNKGFVLAGTNELFDKLTFDEVKRIIGDKIILKNNISKELYLDVLEISFSNSLMNKKNIFILVKYNEKLGEYITIEKSEVYAV